jgi:DNA-binding MarR family transcriptional regulator
MRRLRAESGDPLYARPLVSVLRRLESDGPLTTADLARAEFMTPQSMGASVAELEDHGLVARADDPSDGRRKLVSLSREGSRALAEARARRRGWLVRAIEAELDPPEQRRLLAALELLRRVTESSTHHP